MIAEGRLGKEANDGDNHPVGQDRRIRTVSIVIGAPSEEPG